MGLRLRKKFPWFFRKAYVPELSKTALSANEKGPIAQIANVGMYAILLKTKGYECWPYFSVHDLKTGKYKQIYALFLMQFIDPRPENRRKELIQVFVPPLEYVDETKAIIRRIPFPLIKEENVIAYNEHKFQQKGRLAQPMGKKGWIIDWKIVWEPGLEDDLLMEKLEKKVTLEELKNIQKIKVFHTLKLGGWGESVQGQAFTEYIHNIYHLQYLDAGTLHITEDGSLIGDIG